MIDDGLMVKLVTIVGAVFFLKLDDVKQITCVMREVWEIPTRGFLPNPKLDRPSRTHEHSG